MATIDPVIVKIQADVADLKSGLEQAQASLKGLDDNVKKADGAFEGMTTRLKQLGATIGITFAGSQVVNFFKESINAAQEAQAAQARLATLLRNTNGATEAQIQALGAQAKALEAVGVVSADNITVAQSQLATFDLSAAAIGKLTPAILNYVTAEKGAAASADEFQSMTNGLAQALNGQFGSLTKLGFPLTDLQKKMLTNGTEMERATALTEILNSTYNDFNIKLRETSEGLEQVAKNDLNNLKQEIGEGLQPVIDNFNKFLVDTLIPSIRKFGKFLSENKDTIIAVTKVLVAGVAAFAAYKAAIAITTAATTLYQVAITLLRGQQLATIASTNVLAASMLKLNAVMRANPIGVFITIATTAVAIIVALWKNSETFRNVVIAAGKAALNAFAAIIPMVAQAYEAILKVVTGPLRLLLTALSKLPGVGKYAKAGLDLMNKGLDGISDLGTKAAAKAKELSAKLDGLAKSAEKAGKKTKDALAGGDGGFGEGRKGGGGVDEKTQKKIDALKEKLKGYYKDYDKINAEALKKVAEAQERHDEKIAEAYERFNERRLELQEQFDERMAAAQERFDERKAEALERLQEAEQEARTRHAETVLEIESEYRKRREEITKTRDSRILELERNAQAKREEIMKNGQAKLAEIVEKGRERLRDAWAKGTAFSLTDLFGGAKESGKSLIDTLKNQLTNVRNFQKAAGELAGQGYSQTFIEQIVAAGPEAGMEMIAELRKLSPEQQKEVQNLYQGLESINANGMNAIANTLSTSTQFATDELRQMYLDTQTEITNSLAEVDATLKQNIAEANATYEKALADAAKTRTEKLAEADKALTEALAKAKETYNKALADAQKELNKAQAEAKKAFEKGLVEAQKALEKALLDAQKEFQKRYDEIHDHLMEQINELIEQIVAAMNALNALGAMSGLGGLGSLPAPSVPAIPSTGGGGGGGGGGSQLMANNNITINQNTLTDPQETANAILYAIQYGQVIQVTPGTVTTGMYANQGVTYLE